MNLRRALVAAPAALFVAMAAHVAGFGSNHVLGGSAGPQLFGLGLAWSALLAIAALLGVALQAGNLRSASAASRALADALPGAGRLPALVAALSAGGAAWYAVLEALEGHAVGDSALSLCLIVPLALAVALGTRLTLVWIAGAGLSLAGLASAVAPAAPSPLRLAHAAALGPHASAHPQLRHGRGPPPRA